MVNCRTLEARYGLPQGDVYSEYQKGGYIAYYSWSHGCLLAKERLSTGKVTFTNYLPTV